MQKALIAMNAGENAGKYHRGHGLSRRLFDGPAAVDTLQKVVKNRSKLLPRRISAPLRKTFWSMALIKLKWMIYNKSGNSNRIHL